VSQTAAAASLPRSAVSPSTVQSRQEIVGDLISSQHLGSLDALWSVLHLSSARLHFVDVAALRTFLSKYPETFYFPSDDTLAVSATATEAMAEEALYKFLCDDLQQPEEGMDPRCLIELGCDRYPALERPMRAYQNPLTFFERARDFFHVLDNGTVCLKTDALQLKSDIPVWECHVDGAWSAYSVDHCRQLEQDLVTAPRPYSTISVVSVHHPSGSSYQIKPVTDTLCMAAAESCDGL